MAKKRLTVDPVVDNKEFWRVLEATEKLDIHVALDIIDTHIDEVENKQPGEYTDRRTLGGACLTLLIGAGQQTNKKRLDFVRRVIGPTAKFALFADCPKIVEFREWAVGLIVTEEENRQAADSGPALSDEDLPF